MTVQNLRLGMSGPLVRDLQLALNYYLVPSPGLTVSGHFDASTRRAVIAFQRVNWLEDDGIAGVATLDAIYRRESGPPVLHRVPFLSQPTETTCWATAAAMLKNTTVAMIRLGTPVELLAADGGLLNEAERGSGDTVHRRFATAHGLTYHHPQSWSVQGLVNLVRNGPIMVELLWDAAAFARGVGSSGHYVVIIGVRGAHTAEGRATTFRIYDPYPPGVGAMYSAGYAAMLRRVPLATYGIFTL